MSDNYPRVEASFGHFTTWIASPTCGTHKVVPADAIVIERSDLSSTRIEGGRVVCNGREDPYSAPVDGNPNWTWQYGLNVLSVALFQREHPQDPALVKEITDLALAADLTLSGTQVDNIARYFAATGRVHVDTEPRDV